MDSFPIAVCDNYRIPRCHIYHNEAYRGYKASKKCHCYGLKIHLLITETGQPEILLAPRYLQRHADAQSVCAKPDRRSATDWRQGLQRL